ncbi:hypothetical protein NST14_01985 [Bacillus sp. FSL W8-0519]|uniref:hypothetical protein n=1 Tax=Bacillus TaxID=1386 RepID=UPI001E2EDA19|nr:hypothetical protein [Bacillus paranthracis]MBL3756648.1 hypothetical protein [Bacillus cereus]MCC2412268.1 hypothetical protein [Bacillus paranthracis]
MNVTLDLRMGINSLSIDPNKENGNIELSFQTLCGDEISLILKPEELANLVGALKVIYDSYIMDDLERQPKKK